NLVVIGFVPVIEDIAKVVAEYLIAVTERGVDLQGKIAVTQGILEPTLIAGQGRPDFLVGGFGIIGGKLTAHSSTVRIVDQLFPERGSGLRIDTCPFGHVKLVQLAAVTVDLGDAAYGRADNLAGQSRQ